MKFPVCVTPRASVQSFVAVLLITLSSFGCAAISSPVSQPQVAGFAARLSKEIRAPTDVPKGMMTVDDAVTRAIGHNRDLRSKEHEAAIAEAKVLVESGRMLPAIVAESNYYRRDRPQASHSSLSLTPSTSSDIAAISRDITLSWNILDFGLSYIRTQQGLDRVYQQREEIRLVGGRIAEDTRAAYWRTVALNKLRPAKAQLSGEVHAALALARQAAQDSKLDPMASITFQRELSNLRRELNLVHTQISGADEQLKHLTGMQGIGRLRLNTRRSAGAFPKLSASADADIEAALARRPEVRQHMYDLRITRAEVDATLLQALPGVTLTGSLSSDTNSFLVTSNWLSWGTKLAGNLVRLARVDDDLEVVDGQQRYHRQAALATAAAIVMQVHVARARVAVHSQAYGDAEQSAAAQKQLLAQVEASVLAGKVGPQQLTREKLETLLADVRAILAFAELQSAFANYATAIGDLPAIANDTATQAVARVEVPALSQRQSLGGPAN